MPTSIGWTTETVTDPTTGITTVKVTTYGPQSQAYTQQWTSGAPAVVAAPGVGVAPNAAVGAPDVQAESQVGGMTLLANVAAGTQALGVTVVANPDPSES